MQDWFSPVLINIINPPDDYYIRVFSGGLPLIFVLLVIVPVLISLFALLKVLAKKDFSLVLLFIGLLFFVGEIIMAAKGVLALMSRYTILVLPLMTILVAYGLINIKNKTIYRILTGYIIIINLLFLMFSPSSAPKLVRNEAFNTVANVLNKYPLGQKRYNNNALRRKIPV